MSLYLVVTNKMYKVYKLCSYSDNQPAAVILFVHGLTHSTLQILGSNLPHPFRHGRQHRTAHDWRPDSKRDNFRSAAHSKNVVSLITPALTQCV